jgi:hypothetical protein
MGHNQHNQGMGAYSNWGGNQNQMGPSNSMMNMAGNFSHRNLYAKLGKDGWTNERLGNSYLGDFAIASSASSAAGLEKGGKKGQQNTSDWGNCNGVFDSGKKKGKSYSNYSKGCSEKGKGERSKPQKFDEQASSSATKGSSRFSIVGCSHHEYKGFVGNWDNQKSGKCGNRKQDPVPMAVRSDITHVLKHQEVEESVEISSKDVGESFKTLRKSEKMDVFMGDRIGKAEVLSDKLPISNGVTIEYPKNFTTSLLEKTGKSFDIIRDGVNIEASLSKNYEDLYNGKWVGAGLSDKVSCLFYKRNSEETVFVVSRVMLPGFDVQAVCESIQRTRDCKIFLLFAEVSVKKHSQWFRT